MVERQEQLRPEQIRCVCSCFVYSQLCCKSAVRDKAPLWTHVSFPTLPLQQLYLSDSGSSSRMSYVLDTVLRTGVPPPLSEKRQVSEDAAGAAGITCVMDEGGFSDICSNQVCEFKCIQSGLKTVVPTHMRDWGLHARHESAAHRPCGPGAWMWRGIRLVNMIYVV